MKYIKFLFGVTWVIFTIVAIGIIALMFITVAGYTGATQMMTGVLSTLFVIYLIISFCKGETFLKWIAAPFIEYFDTRSMKKWIALQSKNKLVLLKPEK